MGQRPSEIIDKDKGALSQPQGRRDDPIMATASNSRPARPAAPVLVGHTYPAASSASEYWRLLPAALISAVFHGALIGALMLMPSPGQAELMLDTSVAGSESTTVEAAPDKSEFDPATKDPLQTVDVDPAATDPDIDINYNVDRQADVSVPGLVNPNEPVGIDGGDKTAPPTNLPAPPGFGGGQGGALAIEGVIGNSNAVGMAGGIAGLRGMPLAGTFYGRSGATREKALREGGGTTESEAAVARGLKWIVKQQALDGRWALDGAFKDRGQHNDIAGTAFGLLPLLGAGYTHKAAKNSKTNPFEKPLEKGLAFLMKKQDKRTGNFGGNMYAHSLATIAMCEAYGLSQDPVLRMPSQRAVNFLVTAQHSAGGWRYQSGQAGDLSVTGWVVMALKSAQMAGLDVPELTMRKAKFFVDAVTDTKNEGYCYIGDRNTTPTMSAVGLLCRQYVENWGPNNLRMIKGVDNHLKTSPPRESFKHIYYYYYATQVMHHFGGESWKNWNEKMRDLLIKTQDNDAGSLNGSWSPVGDAYGAQGGRLMITSLSLLTLEVYYRHLPLYYRDAGERRVAGK
jgi:hypothetical protein